MAGTDPITDKQLSFIEALVREREVPPALEAILGMVLCQTRVGASQLIDELQRCPKRVPNDSSVADLRGVQRVPHGTYTVAMGDGTWVTLQLAPAAFVKDRETTAVAFLSGPDNELSYTGFAFLEQDGRVVVWRKFRDGCGRQQAALQLLLYGDVDAAHRHFLDQAEAYALRSGACMRCGKKLTVPASLHRGLGPVCAARESTTATEITSRSRAKCAHCECVCVPDALGTCGRDGCRQSQQHFLAAESRDDARREDYVFGDASSEGNKRPF